MNAYTARFGTPIVAAVIAACTPTVQVQTPEEPITINVNVHIKHEILVKVDEELDEILDEDSELF